MINFKNQAGSDDSYPVVVWQIIEADSQSGLKFYQAPSFDTSSDSELLEIILTYPAFATTNINVPYGTYNQTNYRQLGPKQEINLFVANTGDETASFII